MKNREEAEARAKELYPEWKEHSNEKVNSLGVIVHEAQKQAFLKCYDLMTEQGEVKVEDWVCSQFKPFPNETSATKCNLCGKEKWQHEKPQTQEEAEDFFTQEWGTAFTKATLSEKNGLLELSMSDVYETMEAYKNQSKKNEKE